MKSETTGGILLTDELASWDVYLVTGDVLHLAAHAYGKEQDDYVFVALAKGTPHFEVELARLPCSVVSSVLGGWVRS